MNYWRVFNKKDKYRIVRRDFLRGTSIFFIQKRVAFWWVDLDTLTGTLDYHSYHYERLVDAIKEIALSICVVSSLLLISDMRLS